MGTAATVAESPNSRGRTHAASANAGTVAASSIGCRAVRAVTVAINATNAVRFTKFIKARSEARATARANRKCETYGEPIKAQRSTMKCRCPPREP
jgi:hypothetical protein